MSIYRQRINNCIICLQKINSNLKYLQGIDLIQSASWYKHHNVSIIDADLWFL